jgi:glutathione S-transferase
MRILYQFPTSVFARRVRLALAHKGLDVELRDPDVSDADLAEARRLSPLATMPVLDDDGRVLGDSSAIAWYLDLAYPDRPPLWPQGRDAAHRAVSIVSHVDVAVNTLVDMGTRYYALRADPAWEPIVRERIGRAQAAIDAVAAEATRAMLAGDVWSVADIWALSAAIWVGSMPARASSSKLVAQILTLGFRMPDVLVAWAKQHAGRPDVRAIYG